MLVTPSWLAAPGLHGLSVWGRDGGGGGQPPHVDGEVAGIPQTKTVWSYVDSSTDLWYVSSSIRCSQ